jgi:hypothetical protein
LFCHVFYNRQEGNRLVCFISPRLTPSSSSSSLLASPRWAVGIGIAAGALVLSTRIDCRGSQQPTRVPSSYMISPRGPCWLLVLSAIGYRYRPRPPSTHLANALDQLGTPTKHLNSKRKYTTPPPPPPSFFYPQSTISRSSTIITSSKLFNCASGAPLLQICAFCFCFCVCFWCFCFLCSENPVARTCLVVCRASAVPCWR